MRSFSLNAFEVIDANNETQIGDTHNIILDDSANFMKSAFGGTYSFSASGDNDIVAIGGAASVALNSAGGADIYVVRQDQYGDVSISDSLGSNEIWFEEGVKLVAFDVDETSSFFGTSVNSMALTLSTGAIVTVVQPASSTFQYRLGDGNLVGFTDFRSTVGSVLTSAVTSAVYEVQGELPAASNIASSNDVLYLVHSSANSDIYSLGHNLDYRYNGAGGDDTYVITEYQTGRVVIDDPLAQTIVKLGFGVSVDSIVQDITSSFFGTSYNDLTLTLSSGATVVIKNPNSSSKFYQIGNDSLLSREEFFDAIDGATEADPYVVSKDSFSFTETSYVFSLDENVAGDVTPYAVSSVVATGELNISYSFSDGNLTFGDYSIDSATGVISYTGAGYNYEATPSVTSVSLSVTATSNGASATADVTINIVDVDEFDPVFTRTTDYTLGAARMGLTETQTSKTFSADFSATDADATNNAITYSLSSTLTGLSIGSASGVVSYSGVALDRDIANPVTSYDLTVTATSNGKSTTKDAVLVINAVNEAPVFAEDSYDVNENTSGALFTVNAVDPEGTIVVYSLVSSPPDGFSIDSSTGEVSYTGVGLDHETQDEYSLTVRARSGGQNTNQVVTVNILDVNDAPVVSTIVYAQEIENAATAASFTIPSATFSDEDGDTLYYASSFTVTDDNNTDTSWLTFNASSGEFSVSDQSVAGVYNITVTAMDRDDGTGFSTTGVFKLYIATDVVPEFDSAASYSFGLNENDTSEDFGSVVAIVDTSFAASISYELVGIDGAEVPAGFAIDSTTGAISYAGAGIDYESLTDKFVVLRVQATSSRGNTTATQDVTINILDIAEAPVFTDSTDYTLSANSLSIDEDATSKTFTEDFSATDSDGDTITYSISSTLAGLIIDSTTGVVSYSGAALDQDIASPVTSYTLTVTATSNGVSITKGGVLNINAVDDAAVFINTPYAFSIDENDTSEAFGTITATDDDSDDSAITFSLVAAEGASSVPAGFAITPGGVLSYNGAGIDRESLAEDGIVTVRVQALSNGVTSTTDVAVTVNDVDDNDPVFVDSTDYTLSENSLSIDEDAISKTFTEDFSASDADADATNNAITYSLSSTLTGLSIGSATGVVSYSGSALDQDGSNPVTSYTLTVTATSNGTSITRDALLNINAVDDAPVFTSATDYTLGAARLGLNETQTSKTFSANFAATDVEGDTITYSISSTLTGLSIGSASGVVSYSGVALDVDGSNPVTSYDLTVTATSNGKSTTKDAVLAIGSVNEAPEFAVDSYDVDENSSGVIFTVLATDPEGTAVTYSLVSSPPDGFSIDSATGDVSYTGAGLDHETQDEYSLTVRASSGGQNTNQVMTVNILDVNDAPTLSTIVYAQEIATAATAASFAVPSSMFSDDDGDTLYYSFTVTDDNNTDTSWLTFNASSGEFSVSDQSVAGVYDITLTATDRSDGTGLATTGVLELVIATDVFPEFDSNASYSFDLNEHDTSEDFGSVVATVDVNFLNSTISHKFISIDGEEIPVGFAIDSSTGAISYTGAGYNYESLTDVERTIVLRVQATSSRGNTTATQDVTINILDINDVAVFSSSTPSTLSIDENDTSEAFGTITATDENDDDSAITFALVAAEGASSVPDGFAITPGGVLSYNGTGINREDLPEDGVVIVRVQALSDGDTSTTDIAVTVNDLDEFDIEFVNGTDLAVAANSLTINENQTSKTFSANLSASDGDATHTVTYSLSTTLTGLSLSSTGVVIYSGVALDQDIANPVTSYDFTVTATANGISITRDALLRVITMNEVPEFDAGVSYSFDVDENTSGVIFTVNATDPEGVAVSYSLVSSPPDGFSIDSATGDVFYTGVGLDYETQDEYSLTVRASADGHNTDQVVTVNILDVNDAPTLSTIVPVQEILTAATATSFTIPSSMFSDEDGDTLYYASSFTVTDDNNTDTSWLTFNASSGEFSVSDQSVKGVYNITVTATDRSDGTGLSTTGVFKLYIATDVYPEFDSAASYSFNLSENDTSEELGSVTATVETSFAAVISYELVGIDGEEVLAGFAIDSTTGAISYTGAGLNYESSADKFVALRVQATSSRGNTTTTQDVTINILNVNEAPVFINTPYVYSVNEGASGDNKILVYVGAVQMVDPEGVAVSYSLVSSPPAGFSIGSNTGVITYAASGFNYLAQSTYSLTVRATLNGVDFDQLVTVNVLDINEAPVVSTVIPTQEIETAATATSFTIPSSTFSDIDGDTLFYTGFTVTDDNNTDTSWLTFNATSGVFSISDQSVAGIYDITVTVTDRVFSVGLSVSTTFKLYIATDVIPEFDSSASYSFDLNENDTGLDLGSVIATVATTFVASISYALVGIDGEAVPAGFSIDSTTGAISYTGAGFDYEALTDKFVVLRVQATSSRGDTMVTQDVTINILGINEAPVFAENTDTLYIDEHSGNSIKTIGTISATDLEGSTVSYSLVSAPSGFSIISRLGTIIYDGADLDYETQDEYSLTVRASAGGHNTDQLVTVNVLDINEAPVLTTNLQNKIMTLGQAIDFNISSTFSDVDGDTLDYSFTVTDDNNTDTTSWLTFDSGTNVFSVSNGSVAGVYTITVTATDRFLSVGLSATGIFKLYIATDAPLEFDLNQSYDFDLDENVDGTSTAKDVGNVTASDIDSSAATISYDLVGIDGEAIPTDFSITSGGVIQYTGSGLNYEALTDIERAIVLRVQATSTEGTTIQTVTQDVNINVKDLDDNNPVFVNNTDYTSREYELSMLETETSKTFSEDFSARDSDANSIILYTLTSSNSGMAIDPLTGVVSYSGVALDVDLGGYEGKRSITFSVTATSNNGKSVTRDGRVDIVDVDEFAPSFAYAPNVYVGTTTNHTINIEENAERNSSGNYILLDARLSDRDQPTSLYYFIVVADTSNYLSVTDAGIVYYSGPTFDHETKSSYGVDSIRVDQAFSLKSFYLNLTVNILDVNETPIVSTVIPTQRVEASATATSFTIPSATFSDEDGDTLFYTGFTVTDDNNTDTSWLTLNETSGVFSVSDQSVAGVYNITVTATDRDDGTGFSVSTTFKLLIGNIKAPEFDLNASYSFDLNEADVAQDLGTVIATDLNSSTAIISYDLVEYNGEAIPVGFSIDSSTGEVSYAGAGIEYNDLLSENVTILRVQATSTEGSDIFMGTQDVIVNIIEDAAPVLVNPQGDDNYLASSGLSFTSIDLANNFEDPNGDTLTYTYTVGDGKDADKVSLSSDGVLSIEESFAGVSGNYSITVTASSTGSSGIEQSVSDTFVFRATHQLIPSVFYFTKREGMVSYIVEDQLENGKATGDIDVYNGLRNFNSFSQSGASYGTVKINSIGVWSYVLDNHNAEVNNLNYGEVLVDSFTIAVNNNSTYTTEFTIYQSIEIIISGQTDVTGTKYDDVLSPDSSAIDSFFTFRGEEGNDIITASSYDGDIIIGGYGDDTINLSNNSIDTVVYRFGSNTLNTRTGYIASDGGDIINDFEIGVDILNFIDVEPKSKLEETEFFASLNPTDNQAVLTLLLDSQDALTGVRFYFNTNGTVDGGALSTQTGNQLTINFSTSIAKNDWKYPLDYNNGNVNNNNEIVNTLYSYQNVTVAEYIFGGEENFVMYNSEDNISPYIL